MYIYNNKSDVFVFRRKAIKDARGKSVWFSAINSTFTSFPSVCGEFSTVSSEENSVRENNDGTEKNGNKEREISSKIYRPRQSLERKEAIKRTDAEIYRRGLLSLQRYQRMY